MISLALAQVLVTPPPIFASPTPTPLSERGAIESRLAQASAHAKALGGTLGAVVIDAATGASVAVEGDARFPLAEVRNLAIALAAYERVDRHRLTDDAALREKIARMLDAHDAQATASLLTMLGGSEAVDEALRDDGLDAIFVGDDGRGTATPRALAALFTKLFQGDLLSSSSRAALLAQLARDRSAPERLRAGFPRRAFLAHVTGTSPARDGVVAATNDAGIVTVNGRTLVVVAMLRDARGDAAARDAILASVARAVAEATALFPLQ
ncbi:MAG: serine hydrolase [bacterium]|nr:serine hydrolase [bacterium]